MKLIPNKNFLIAEPSTSENVTSSGILLPDSNKSTSAKVIAIGGDETVFSVGDTIIFKEWSYTEYKFEDKKYLIIKKDDILAYVKTN